MEEPLNGEDEEVKDSSGQVLEMEEATCKNSLIMALSRNS